MKTHNQDFKFREVWDTSEISPKHMEAGGPGSVQRNQHNKSGILRRIVFTLNNYTPEEYEHLCEIARTTKWFIMGMEVGENGTPHLQGL